MIFLKPHWIAALTVSTTEHELEVRLGWIQGTIGDELLLQAERLITMRPAAYTDEAENCRYPSDAGHEPEIGQYTVPLKKSILLGDKLPGWDTKLSPLDNLEDLSYFLMQHFSLVHSAEKLLTKEANMSPENVQRWLSTNTNISQKLAGYNIDTTKLSALL